MSILCSQMRRRAKNIKGLRSEKAEPPSRELQSRIVQRLRLMDAPFLIERRGVLVSASRAGRPGEPGRAKRVRRRSAKPDRRKITTPAAQPAPGRAAYEFQARSSNRFALPSS